MLELVVADDPERGPLRVAFESIELEPAPLETIPAPAPFELEDTQPDKPAGTCVAPGCNERSGFHFAPQYCERHGLGGLGVKT